IPPLDVLFLLIEQLFATYGPLKDSSTNVLLFNHYNWKTERSILELVRQGYVSDPPGISLYTVISLDSKAGNLPIYRCSRGTNFTEGGIHTHLLSCLPLSGVSVYHLNACLCDFVLQHNLHVCFYSCTPCTLMLMHFLSRWGCSTALARSIVATSQYGLQTSFKSDFFFFGTFLLISLR
ncbi:hypothetical protein L208DRAFT_1229436, partial [Tricholoma matsutake]